MRRGIAVREHRLGNGLLVLVVERPSHPVVSTMIWYRAGSRDEPSGATGVAHFLEHMMFKGTGRIAKGEIDLITSRLGGSNNAFTDYDATAYYFHLARDRWEAAFAIEAERMRGCLLDAEEIERERKVVLEELRMGLDDPWRELAEEVGAAVYQAHPYHHPVIGWQGDVQCVSREQMERFYRSHYAPDRAMIVVAGDVRFRDVVAAAKRHFGRIPRARIARPPVAPEPPQRGERRLRVERDTPLRRLLVGWQGVQCGSRDDWALDVLSTLLAAGRSSRLYVRLVKEERLASHVTCENESRLDPGAFWISLEALEGVREEPVEEALFEEIERVRDRPVAHRELDRAKRQILAGQAAVHESASDLAERVGRMEALGSWRLATSYGRRISAVTAARVRDAAQRLLGARSRTVGWSVPACDEPGHDHAAHGGTHAKKAARAARRVVFERAPRKSTFRVPPRRGAAPVVRLPFVRETLENGLVLLTTRNDAAPTAAFSAFVDIGLECESSAQAGLENLTGECLDEGSRRYGGDEITRRIEEEGGWISSASRGVQWGGLAGQLETAVEIVASLLAEPTFPADAVQRVREEVLSELLADEEDLRTRAFRRLRAEIYGRHPLHRPGEGRLETVRRLRRADLVAFHRAWYAPGRTILAFSGDRDPRDVARLVRRSFARWKGSVRPLPKSPPVPEPRARLVVDRCEREQVHLAIGHRGIRRDDPDWFPLLVLDHVLGTGPGFTDRISRRLRDEEALAYSVSANVTASSGRDPGIFAAHLSTSPRNAERARKGMLREIRRVQTEPPSADEVRVAKDYLIGSFPFALERNAGRAQQIVRMERYGLGADFVERYPERVEAVTTADVARAARAHLHPREAAVVCVGPVPERFGAVRRVRR